jgi:NAD(P)-dependent dehydrogenase (short-subunit alcohol dehydrogenase family)
MSKKILITGISSGIGHALAKHYLDQGHKIYGVSRRTPADLIENDSMHFLTSDLESLDNIAETLKELLNGVDRLDCVILNAGTLGTVNDLQDLSIDEIQRTMNINLWSNKILIDALLKLSVQIPQIIAISSGAAVHASRGWGGYSISKAGLNVIMKLYAEEVTDTQFISMSPGLVDTAMQEYLCEEVNDARFKSINRLQEARKTPDMPTPSKLAPILVEAFDEAKKLPSGAYVDIRDMDAFGVARKRATNRILPLIWFRLKQATSLNRG